MASGATGIWRRSEALGRGSARRVLVAAVGAGLFALNDFGASARESEGPASATPSGAPTAEVVTRSAGATWESKRSSRSTQDPRKDPLKPAEIEIAVLNGAGTTGLATQTSSQLQNDEFGIEKVRDAPEPRDRSLVMHWTSARREARLVGRRLGIPRVERVSDEIEAVAEGTEVIVVLGGDRATSDTTDPDTGD